MCCQCTTLRSLRTAFVQLAQKKKTGVHACSLAHAVLLQAQARPPKSGRAPLQHCIVPLSVRPVSPEPLLGELLLVALLAESGTQALLLQLCTKAIDLQ
jgi:hypothetical protein